MEQLRDALQEFGWTKYEAACYSALVRLGSMKASALASETGIMQSKIYQPLNSLEDDSYVRITDTDPKIYAAQNPQYVIEREERKFNREKQQILEKLQEGWEIGEEYSNEDDRAWVVKGREGKTMELSKLIDSAENTLRGFDSRFIQAPRDALEALEEQAEDGLDIKLVGPSQARSRLQRLAKAGVSVRELTDITRTSYYIADGERVLMNLSNGNTTVTLEDADIVGIISTDFEEMFKEAAEVTNNDDD